jgi:hypothetical protein
MRLVAEALAPKLTGVTVDEAADVLYTLGSVPNYLSLVAERHWSRERYTRWLARSLRGALLDR